MHVIKDLSSIYIGLTSLKRLLLLLCHTTVKGKVIFSITICNNMMMLHRVCHNRIIFVICNVCVCVCVCVFYDDSIHTITIST